MLKFFKKLFNRKVADLDNDGKIEGFMDEIQGVFAKFNLMHRQIETVNTELNAIMEEEQAVKEKAEANIAKAQEQIDKNKKLQEKVSEFMA
ncbi:hypothetical protein PQE66_gp002 [Bacillus phage PBC2]|uniref:Uncharacterized protein n=1 Tax=Bacillus phage PBC2 TaxID=1675029 RepID=A0A218KBP8_9CAUD|nr:hypothetical protein PQE66_gp002 [Bacillus phage PBC2]AKQ08317.1 hypothetical protein PBC2_002 [Bacillus phage PBC2]